MSADTPMAAMFGPLVGTGPGAGMALIMVAGLVYLVLANGLGFFWPSDILRLTLKDGTVLLGADLTIGDAITAPVAIGDFITSLGTFTPGPLSVTLPAGDSLLIKMTMAASDSDGAGDACDSDDDGDSVADCNDQCPGFDDNVDAAEDRLGDRDVHTERPLAPAHHRDPRRIDLHHQRRSISDDILKTAELFVPYRSSVDEKTVRIDLRNPSLVDVGGPVPSGITALTGIDDALLEGAPCEGDALESLAAFLAQHRVERGADAPFPVGAGHVQGAQRHHLLHEHQVTVRVLVAIGRKGRADLARPRQTGLGVRDASGASHPVGGRENLSYPVSARGSG